MAGWRFHHLATACMWRRATGFAGQVDSTLQLLKSGRVAPGVERDDLSVENDRVSRLPRPCGQRGDYLRELAGFFVTEPRPQPHAARRQNFRNRPDAVVFWFV